MSTTSAAELYYLFHSRSCAAAATGNKGGQPGSSNTLQICGADFIARLLQSIWRYCYLKVSIPLARLLQSIRQIGKYYAKSAMKLVILFGGLLRDILDIAQEVART